MMGDRARGLDLVEAVLAAPAEALAAIDDDDRRLTYAELRLAAHARADMLAGGTGLVLLEGGNDCAWLIAYVACLIARRPMLIAPGGNPAAATALEAAFAPATRLTAAGGYMPECTGHDDGETPHPDLALMLSTSGSTGSAKCVRLSAANLAANAAAIGAYLGLAADERGVVNLPTHYSYGLSIVNSHLMAGAALLFTARSVIEPGFWDFCARHGATSFAGVPHTYDLLERADLGRRAPATLRYFTQAGGRLPPRLAERYAALADARGWRFFVMYGQTEATARMAYMPPERLAANPDCIGLAIPGGRFSLADGEGLPIEAPDVDGELIYEGPNVMMGYAFASADVALSAGPPQLATGDLARRRADGLWQITGRLNRFIKIFGNRIGLDDVERLLGAGGHEAIATGIDDKLLVVTRDAAAAPSIATLLQARLKLPPDYLEVRAVTDYPVMASGKIDYAVLKSALCPSAAAAVVATEEGGEAVIAAFTRAFGEAGREEEATFRSLGGDSLGYVNTALALETAIPNLPDDWDSRSIGSLVTLASGQGKATAGPRTGRRLLSRVDTVRGFACLLIVAFHFVGMAPDDGMRVALDSHWHYVMNSFAMVRLPLFTALAGYIYGAMPASRDGFGRFIGRKAKQLLIPMVFATIVYLVLRRLSDGRDESIAWAFLGGYRHLWYLETLVTIFAIVGLIDVWLKPGARGLLVLLAGGVTACLLLPGVELFHFTNTLFMLPFFVWGVLLYRRPELLGSRITLGVAAVVLAGALLIQQLSMNGIGITGDWAILRAPESLSFAGVLPWFAGCAAIVVLIHLFPRFTPLERIAGYSYAIYLWHPLANNAVQMVMRRIDLHNDLLFFAVGVGGGALLPIALQIVVVRWFPRLSLPVVGR
ncbi:AMP-binding protein [Sphingomonas solaris]|uniref:AMP-binding protein n=1 Tax=Alterirhizorhabdus solaris TaxID=2529389 RepID=A0A558QW16_9SPHN|nr:AMP-binding protein [Sphingomonas solaris]TVV71262.1 AMP-binding protein [Sphingomonas solaris]